MSTSKARRQQSRKRKSEKRGRRIRRRLKQAHERRGESEGPAMRMSRMKLEMSDRIHAHGMGGLGLVHQMVHRLGLDSEIDKRVKLFVVRQGYAESDHVLAQAYNVMAGGHCLNDMQRMREDEALLDNLSAPSLPAPSTAGDFCRRFRSKADVDSLMDAINATRVRVWSGQPEEFKEEASHRW